MRVDDGERARWPTPEARDEARAKVRAAGSEMVTNGWTRSLAAAVVVAALIGGCGEPAPTSARPSTAPAPTGSARATADATAARTAAPSPMAPPAPTAGPTATPSPAAPPAPTAARTAAPTLTTEAMPLRSTTTWAVAPGDTLWSIGQRYGLSVEQLLAANPQVSNPSVIRVGERLAIPLYALRVANATLELPALPTSGPPTLPSDGEGAFYCAQGRVTFTDGYAFPRGAERTRWYESTWIEDVVRADVDRDGKADVVALVRCQPSQGSFGRVVAFRERPDGTFATIGLVLQQDWDAPDYDNQIARVSGIDATPGGEVTVGVSDIKSTFTDGPWQGLCQWRTYGWDGQTFVQTAGPATFVVPPGTASLSVEASPMTYAPAVNGGRAGTMTVTVRNEGTNAVEGVAVLLALEPAAVCAAPGTGEGSVCEIGRLGPRAEATVTFHQAIRCRSGEECTTRTDEWGDLQVRIGDQKYSDVLGIRLVFE